MIEYRTVFYYDRGLKIRIDEDVRRYYLWHLYRSAESTLGMVLPSGKAHVSVTLPRHHGDDLCEVSRRYAGLPVTVYLTHNIRKGGSWFTNYYLKVECPYADEIKKRLGIKRNFLMCLRWEWVNRVMSKLGFESFLGFHVTFANDKHFINNGSPEMTELTVRYNKGELTTDQFREEMTKLKNELKSTN